VFDRIIPITDLRRPTPSPTPVNDAAVAIASPASDRLRRPLHDLRISVTDRCNFRCGYCMPRDAFGSDHAFLPNTALLGFDDIARLARHFVALGVEKLRLTGGEPLLRRGIEELVERLAPLRTPAGRPVELTLTTNGALLARKAKALHQAGLTRLTVSLDALDDTLFRRMNDADFPVADVLHGIEAAAQAGFEAIKLNMVVQRGVNDGQILPMARFFKGRGHILRFIEYMDTGNTNGWRLDQVVPSAEVLRTIGGALPIRPLTANYPGEVAERWAYCDGSGEIGVVSSVTRPFCSGCTRARLSTDGQLYLCLFAERGYDLKSLLRGGVGDEQLLQAIASIWQARDDRYSDLRAERTSGLKKIEMSYIGG
jgi:cyclic pyranopterin phosphate synthase